MALIEGIVGNNRGGVGDGSPIVARMGKTGEMIVGDAHAEHFEASSRGNVFTGATATAGCAVGSLTISTTCAHLLYNPIGSGVNLSMIQASAWYVSGTLGAGLLLYTTNSGVAAIAPTAGTAITSRSALIQGGNAAPKGVCQTLSTSVPSMVTLRPFCTLLAYAGAAIGANFPLKDQLNGEFVVPPGFFFGIHGITAAGTSPIMGFSFTWEEVPIT